MAPARGLDNPEPLGPSLAPFPCLGGMGKPPQAPCQALGQRDPSRHGSCLQKPLGCPCRHGEDTLRGLVSQPPSQTAMVLGRGVEGC